MAAVSLLLNVYNHSPGGGTVSLLLNVCNLSPGGSTVSLLLNVYTHSPDGSTVSLLLNVYTHSPDGSTVWCSTNCDNSTVLQLNATKLNVSNLFTLSFFGCDPRHEFSVV